MPFAKFFPLSRLKFYAVALLLSVGSVIFAVDGYVFPKDATLTVHFSVRILNPKTKKVTLTTGSFGAPAGSTEKTLQKMLKHRFPKNNAFITGVTVNKEHVNFTVKFTRTSPGETKQIQDECIITDCYTEAYAENYLKLLWPDSTIVVQSITRKD